MGQSITPMITTKFKELKAETLEISDSASIQHDLESDTITANIGDIRELTADTIETTGNVTVNGIVTAESLIGSLTFDITLTGTGNISISQIGGAPFTIAPLLPTVKYTGKIKFNPVTSGTTCWIVFIKYVNGTLTTETHYNNYNDTTTYTLPDNCICVYTYPNTNTQVKYYAI